MAQRRLSADGRAELEAKREQLQPELRLIEGELDEAVRVQAAVRPADARPRLSGRWLRISVIVSGDFTRW